jgi:hypothetical protein
MDLNIAGDTLNDLFCSGEFSSLLDVPLHELDYWVKCKIVNASVRSAAGHGSRRLFNRDDLRQALLVRRLRRAKWKPRHISDALLIIGSVLRHPDNLQTPLLIHEGRSLLILCRNEDGSPSLMDASCPGQYVMVIALETLEEETRLSIARSK